MRTLPPLGELTRAPKSRREWVSRPVAVPFLLGRQVVFKLNVGGKKGKYPPDVAEAVERFLSLGGADRRAAADRVFALYREFADDVPEVAPEIAGAAGVWEHLQITGIRVDRRDGPDKDVYVRVMAECDWDGEHGLQVVFRRGERLVRVSGQDGHLTDADAYDRPEDEDA